MRIPPPGEGEVPSKAIASEQRTGFYLFGPKIQLLVDELDELRVAEREKIDDLVDPPQELIPPEVSLRGQGLQVRGARGWTGLPGDGRGCQGDVSLQEDFPGPAVQRPSRLWPRVSAGPPKTPRQHFPARVPLPVSHGCTTTGAERCIYLSLQGPDLASGCLKINVV